MSKTDTKSQELQSRGPVEAITKEQWYYFLEVLPHVYMNRNLIIDGRPVRASFGFAEGRELVTAFWTKSGGHYFRQLTNELNPCW